MISKAFQNIILAIKTIPLRLVIYYSGSFNKFTIEYWQNYIFYLLALVGLVIGALGLAPIIIYLFSCDRVLDGINLILLYTIDNFIIFYKPFPFHLKAMAMGLVFYTFGLNALMFGGPAGESGIWFVCNAVHCSLFLGLKTSLMFACLNFLTGVTVAFLYHQGFLGWDFLKEYSFSHWISQCTNVFFITVSFIFANTMLIKGVKNAFKVLNKNKEATIIGLAKLAEYRDNETRIHLDKIREYAVILALKMSEIEPFRSLVDEQYLQDLYISSALHDIGKVGISDSILIKSGKLTDTEFEIIKKHTVYGKTVIQEISNHLEDKSVFNMAEDIAYCHHERWDGTGYPEGLSGENIPLSARIVALVDVYDTITSKRPYKQALTHDEAVHIIAGERGKYFDPRIVEVFLLIEKEFHEIQERYV